MRRTQLMLTLILILVTPLAALATCDGGGACNCGSTVDANTRLSPDRDPVCSSDPTVACPGHGLTVNPGVVLDLGGCTLRGAGGATGVIADAGSQVRGGAIIGFGTGVFLSGNGGTLSRLRISDGAFRGVDAVGDSNTLQDIVVQRLGDDCVTVFGNDNVLSRLQAMECGFHGVAVTGQGNTVEHSRATGNGTSGVPDKGTGILFFGNGNTARTNRLADNAHDGLAATGDNLVITGNYALGSGQCGVFVFGGTNGTIERNQVRSSGTSGICLQGSAHQVSSNTAIGSAEAGFNTDATGSVLDRNRSQGNGNEGMFDSTTGAGTAGTANTYTGNVCAGNAKGDSDPLGLCR